MCARGTAVVVHLDDEPGLALGAEFHPDVDALQPNRAFGSGSVVQDDVVWLGVVRCGSHQGWVSEIVRLYVGPLDRIMI